ncbi:MAG: hypothetical protein QM757_21100 [Paludibaculum sp.]
MFGLFVTGRADPRDLVLWCYFFGSWGYRYCSRGLALPWPDPVKVVFVG